MTRPPVPGADPVDAHAGGQCARPAASTTTGTGATYESPHEALDAGRRAIDEFSTELERARAALVRIGESIEQVRCAWEACFRETIMRLDQIQAHAG